MVTNCRNDTGKLIQCKATHDALVEPLEKSVKLNVLCKLLNVNNIHDGHSLLFEELEFQGPMGPSF